MGSPGSLSPSPPPPPSGSDEVPSFNIKVTGCVWEGTLTATKKTIVCHLKLMIRPLTNLRISQQLLFLLKDGDNDMVALDGDECDMEHYGVKEGDRVWLYAPFRNVKLLLPSMGLEEVVRVSRQGFVEEIRHHVMASFGVPVGSLSLCCQGFLLEDGDTLENHGFGDGLEVYGFVRKEVAGETMSLTASVGGVGDFEIEVEECFTARDVKAVVESVCNVPVGLLEVWKVNKLKNWESVRSCELKPKMKLNVVVLGSELTLRLDDQEGMVGAGKNMKAKVLADTRHTVREIMNVMPEGKERPGQEMALFVGDTRLEPHKYLPAFDNNVDAAPAVSLKSVIWITVTVPGGGIMAVDLLPEHTIEYAKRKIERVCEIPCWMQKLSHFCKHGCPNCIRDDMQLSACQTMHGGLSSLRWNTKWSFFCPTYGFEGTSMTAVSDDLCEMMTNNW